MPGVLAELLRVLPVAVLIGTVPGYFWAKCLSPPSDRVELLDYTTAVSATAVFASGIAASDRITTPKLPLFPPSPPGVYALAPLLGVFWLVLGAAFGHHPENLDFVRTDGTIELE